MLCLPVLNILTCCCSCCWVASVVSDPVRPQRRQPTRLPRPWDSPSKNTGAGCHFLFQCMKVKSESEVAQSCPTPSDPMDCSPPGSSVHGIFHPHLASPNFLFTWKKLLPFQTLSLRQEKKQIKFHFKPTIIIAMIYHDNNYLRWLQGLGWGSHEEGPLFHTWCSKQWLNYYWVDDSLEYISLALLIILITFLSLSPAVAPVFAASWGSMSHRPWDENKSKRLS